MPRGKYLTEQEMGKIKAFKELNIPVREIARRISRSHNVVINFLKNPDNYGQNKTGGPKKKLTSRSERRIINAVSNSRKSLSALTSELNLNVSRSTVYRAILRSPHISRQKLKKAPRLLPRHKEARMKFARENMQTDWTKVRTFFILFFFNFFKC